MGFIQLDDLSLAFGARTILSGVRLTISTGERIALSGANGSGKSTLMQVCAGLIPYDSGRIIRSQHTKVAYLPQSSIVHRGNSLQSEVLKVLSELTLLTEEAERITEELKADTRNQEALLHRYQTIQDILERSNWHSRYARVDQILRGLGFQRDDFEKDAASFSGGWQMRIALAKILLASPDILLLDEPTNYLDLEAREWLQDFIKGYLGAVMLVSHDRGFLDATCSQVAEILMTRVTLHKKTFSEYEACRDKEMAALVERWKRQQEEITRIEAFINRFRYKDSKAAQVQSRVKMLEKMERIEIPPALKRIHLRFPAAPRCGKIVIKGENLGRNYADKTVFSNLDLEFPRGSKTAVVGINGAGKSTLLRIIAGQDDKYSGQIKIGHDVKIGYFSQDLNEAFVPSLTVFEEAARGSGEGEGRLCGLLGGFLFSGDDIHKRVEVLSGGEKNRLALLKLLLEPVNLLILDEPTNHLDINSKDILLEALEDFGGTLIIVSHDKYFLERVADRVLELKDGRGRMFLGDYAYYRWRSEEYRHASAYTNSQEISRLNQPSSDSKQLQQFHKEERSRLARLKKEEERLSGRIEVLEAEEASVRGELERRENYGNPVRARELSERLTGIQENIRQLNTEWEEAAMTLEAKEAEYDNRRKGL